MRLHLCNNMLKYHKLSLQLCMKCFVPVYRVQHIFIVWVYSFTYKLIYWYCSHTIINVLIFYVVLCIKTDIGIVWILLFTMLANYCNFAHRDGRIKKIFIASLLTFVSLVWSYYLRDLLHTITVKRAAIMHTNPFASLSYVHITWKQNTQFFHCI